MLTGMTVNVVSPPSAPISQIDGANAMPTAQQGSSHDVISDRLRPPNSLIMRGAPNAPASPQAALIDSSEPISTDVAPRLLASTMTISSIPGAMKLIAAAQVTTVRR